jgi:hypothetical protein
MEYRLIDPPIEKDTEFCSACFHEVEQPHIIFEDDKESFFCNKCYNTLILKL